MCSEFSSCSSWAVYSAILCREVTDEAMKKAQNQDSLSPGSGNALVEQCPSVLPLYMEKLNNPTVNVHSHIKYTIECSITSTLHCILSVDSVCVIYSSQKKTALKT